MQPCIGHSSHLCHAMYASNYSIDTPSNLPLLPLSAHPIHVPVPLNQYPSMTIRRLSSEDVISPLKPSTQASRKRGYIQTHACHHKPGAYPDSLLIDNSIQGKSRAKPNPISQDRADPMKPTGDRANAMPCHSPYHVNSPIPNPIL